MREKGILIVVSGFSGSGKGTIMKELLKQYDNYALSISATTRNPRPGEEDGREYFFKTVEDFEKMIAIEELIEYARYVVNFLFVTPPSAEELKSRLVGRGTETMDVIEFRMNRAKEEALEMDQYDYLIINDDLQECVEEMLQIIQCELRRSFRNAEFIEHMKEEL